jgi:hypothetical protein
MREFWTCLPIWEMRIIAPDDDPQILAEKVKLPFDMFH